MACGASTAPTAMTAEKSDPPKLVLWTQVGDIKLGEPLKQVTAQFGREPGVGYRLHGGTVLVGAWWPHSGVTSIYITTPYYRTSGGFGVGSAFPKAWRSSFIDNPTLKEKPCGCWVKVGTGKHSLQPSTATFGQPWVIVYVSHGKVTAIDLSSKYVD